MPSLAEIVGSFTPLTRTGEEWQGACPIEAHAEPLTVIGERVKCFGCGFQGDALAFLRAVGEPDPDHALTNGRIWTPTLSAPIPPPSRYAISRVSERPDATVLITAHRKAAVVAAKLLPSYAVAAWPDGGSRWDTLEPLRGRKVLLWPSPDSAQDFERLEAVLTDPAGLACQGKILTEGCDLSAWDRSADELIAWAREHVRPLKNPAPQVPNPDPSPGLGKAEPQGSSNVEAEATTSPASPPPVALDPVQEAIGRDLSDSEPPPVSEADFPPEAATTRPKPRKPRLQVVGNTALAPDPDSEPLPADMSEDHLADVFAQQHGENWRYVKEWDRWFQYDGDGWRPDKTELVDRLAVKLCRSALYWPQAAALTPDGRKRIGQRRTAGQVRDMARNDRRIAATVEQWDTNPMLLGCPGGAIDLVTGKLIESDRESYITMRTAVAPERGEPELWLSHLHKTLQGDADTIAFLRRYFGYMLTGKVGEHCLVFFYGTGRNGKGTIVETVIKLLGDYGYAAPMNLLMESKNERHPTELAALRSRRAVSASEPPEGARWDDGRIRWLTGGDTITARGMRQDLYSFQPTHKLLLMGNHTPSLRSVDEAVRARFRVIEFNHFFQPEDRDIHFTEKLEAEWPRILQWMIEGCLEWQDCGLGLPEKIEQATSEYLQSEDEFADWIIDCVDVAADSLTRSADAYRNFREWAEKRGSYVPSQKAFSRKLKDRGYASTRTSEARFFKGFSLKFGANL